MNSTYEQEPFSLSEFAAGSIAVAAVALIALQGARVSRPPDPSPANLPSADPSPVTPPRSSPGESQGPRPAPAPMASTQSNEPPESVMAGESESSGLAAGTPPATSPGATRGGRPADFLVEAAPAATVEIRSPDIAGAPPPLIAPFDLFHTKDAISVQPPKPIREAAIPVQTQVPVQAPAPYPAERNPSNRPDAIWIQTKLRDLGYYAGNAIGVWGWASRNALLDFKTMNGLAEDDKWDQQTEQRLVSKQNVHASTTFIGGWAQSVEECQHFRGYGAPLIIRSRGAETDRVKCSFRSIKREVATTWRLQAACSADGQSWNANVSLKLTGSTLNWSSENGKETYVRCAKP